MPNRYLLPGLTGPWEVVIGLEVHAQIVSKAKLMSGAATAFGAEPNSQVSFIDAGFPGMLPVVNAECVDQAVRTGLGLNAQINLRSVFDRKNYFYADLPQGYQITQFAHPIVGKGALTVELSDGTTRTIGITRLHLEQDAGKSLHDQHPSLSYIDLNRAGVALMEIVSEPDMQSPEEAGAYVKKLRSILRYLGTCDGNMEEGSMRCDVNVSVNRPGSKFGTRCEIKNVNSIRNVMLAIEYEAKRQISLLEDGRTIRQETRLFDAARGETRSMRSKEEAHDYRYFPDPDLLPLVLDAAHVEALKAELPELPDAKRARLVEQYKLSAYDAGVLADDRAKADFFETAARGRDAKIVSNWLTGELFAMLNKRGLDITASPVSANALGELVDLVSNSTISGKVAKDVFVEMSETGKAAALIVKEKNLVQITDMGTIEKAVDVLLAANPDKVAAYKNGKNGMAGFFTGQVIKAMGGTADPKAVDSTVRRKLES